MQDASQSTTRLLIIDDDEKLARLLHDYLEPLGYQVDLAHNGIAGLSKAQEGNYSAIILDVMMPGMNGMDVLRELRKTSQVPVLMLTALGDEPDRIEHCERETCAEGAVAAPGHRGVIAIDPSDRWIYAAQAESVIGIWRPTDRQFFQLAEPARLYGVVVLRDATYLVVVAGDRRYRFIELPPDA